MGAGRRTDLEAVRAAIQEGVDKRQLVNDHFEAYIKYHAGIDKAIAILKPPTVVRGDHALESFAAAPRGWQPIDAESLATRFIILTGPSGIGKTQFALAHFQNPLFVSHIEQLKQLEGGDYDGVIFDDMSFAHFPREARIHLCDLKFDREIHCRFANAKLPAKFPRILTTNKSFQEVMFKPEEDHTDYAIARRCHVYNLTIDE